MKTLRKIIEIDEELCDGCGQCIPSCAEGALEIVDGKAQIIADKLCDGLGRLGECPTGALKVVEREADEFDEEAVGEHLSEKEKEVAQEKQHIPCGCPSTQIQTFVPIKSHPETQIPAAIGTKSESASLTGRFNTAHPTQSAVSQRRRSFGAGRLCCRCLFKTHEVILLKGKW